MHSCKINTEWTWNHDLDQITTDDSACSTISSKHSYSNVELECVKDIDFGQGFDSHHFRFEFQKVISPDPKEIIEFDTVTNFPGSNRSSTLTWRLHFDGAQDQDWFGLKLVTRLERLLPVMYRAAVCKDDDGKPMVQWGNWIIYRPSPSQIIWHAFDGDHPDQLTLLKGESQKGLRLHLFLEIPFSYFIGSTEPTAELLEPRFTLDGVSDVTVLQLANLFHEVVIGDLDESGDEDEVLTNNGVDVKTMDADAVRAIPDITIKVIDRQKKSEQSFNCHRTILSLSSSFFANLFRRRHRSSRSNRPSTVEEIDQGSLEIDDIDAETMQHVLRYIYCGCFPKLSEDDSGDGSLDTVLKITNAAYKFGLNDWKKYCLSVLLFEHTDDESRLLQLDLALKWSIEQLLIVCREQLSTALYALNCGIMDGQKETAYRLAAGIAKSVKRFKVMDISPKPKPGLGRSG